MKTILIIGCFLFSLGFSQSWRSINQSDYNVKYKLPSTWEIDGFGGNESSWENPGSSVCECAGTINFGPERKLGMVIYPNKDNFGEQKREYVWDYHFISVSSELESYNTKKLFFNKFISKWEQPNGSDDYIGMLNDEVWKFTSKSNSYGFVIYFWGDPEIVKQNETIIYQILDSFVQVKK